MISSSLDNQSTNVLKETAQTEQMSMTRKGFLGNWKCSNPLSTKRTQQIALNSLSKTFRDLLWVLFTMQMWRISTLFCFIFLPLFCVLSQLKCIIYYFSGWFNPSLMEKLWFDNSKLAGWFTKGRDILPSFWHSSPSHYWHYIWKLSHLLGSILWFMIPTKKRNGDQWSFNKSSYYSYYPSSHVWLVAGMQCKAILIKKIFTNVWNLFQNISSPWSTVATPCNASCGGGIEVKVRSCTNPRPQVGWWWVGF